MIADKAWIWAAGAVALVGAWLHYSSVIGSLEKELAEAESKLNSCNERNVLEQANNMTMKAAIEDMNRATRKLNEEHEQAMAEYEAYKALPTKVRYETLYKYVSEEGSNECEDIKHAIDGVSRYVNDRMR